MGIKVSQKRNHIHDGQILSDTGTIINKRRHISALEIHKYSVAQ